ncbi:MAG: hypothetical protein LBE78_09255 [Burkholderiaceae bacterium]|jgi:hypothetical protein|nr:hypothetical protein [Burkholderiaceae bacterium]
MRRLKHAVMRMAARRRWFEDALKAATQPDASQFSPAATHWNIDCCEWRSEQRLRVAGWALGAHGLPSIVVMRGGREIATLSSGLKREDVAAAFPGYPDAGRSGFDGECDLGALGPGIDVIAIVAKGADGRQTSLLRRSVFAPAFKRRWSALLDQRGVSEEDIFYLPIATSHVAHGGAEGIKETFGGYESRTVKVGIRVQILYLRTTRGAAADYVFDPDFVADKRCGDRLIAEDGLNDVIRFAVTEQMPVLFTLNGGIWADSACEALEWDVNDVLERDANLCQWNENNQVMPDTALADLPGSVDAPELGRSLSLNVYMSKTRFYKKRNLQQAALLIARFAQEHPHLFIGVALDPDVYINPFFEGAQWYDYNPATLRQFRHWLRGDGPYAGDGGADAPDLSRYRRATSLTLAEIDALAGKRHASWEEVDAPRKFPRRIHPFWEHPWYAVWEQFRRHLVKLHYDELSQWVAEAGIGTDRIYSSQGFMPPGELFDPIPERLDSVAKNYDTAGVSIEGSVPSHGRLGAIIYGASAINRIRMEGQASLFAEFRRYSLEWAVVEHNTADLKAPQRPATYAQAYCSLREIVNYGARLVSPMAWNGSPGEAADTDNFRAYTSLRRSPLEEAMTHFMLARADLPRRARLWTFGAVTHSDDDGWQVGEQPAVAAHVGALAGQLDVQGSAVFTSPPELACAAGDYQGVVVQAQVLDPTLTLALEAQTDDGSWRALCLATPWLRLEQSAAGAWIAITHATFGFDRIRLAWRGRPGAALTINAIALYPR